jgi:hypothetical protein
VEDLRWEVYLHIILVVRASIVTTFSDVIGYWRLAVDVFSWLMFADLMVGGILHHRVAAQS